MVEHVSGNAAEFEMGSLVPGTRYTVGVHAMKEAQKSDSAVTEFTTGGCTGETFLDTATFMFYIFSDEPLGTQLDCFNLLSLLSLCCCHLKQVLKTH